MVKESSPPSSILIIGNGAREHALGISLESPRTKLFFAPGNAGTAEIGENIPYEDAEDITRWARKHDIALTVVGPEDALADGIVDRFAEEGLQIFGPTQRAAFLETSKASALAFMDRHHIPHPVSRSFTHREDALSYVANFPTNGVVVKADGPAAGKGVTVADSPEEAVQAITELMVDRRFGTSGETVIIQERLFGPEVSILAFCDGHTFVAMSPARDHKRLEDGNKGPNTGGMGAVSPVDDITEGMMQCIKDTILKPTIDGMREEGMPFTGILFVGVMLTENGPQVLEYNARFGDPETQVTLPRLGSPLAPILLACIQGTLTEDLVQFSKIYAVGVVLATEEYPQKSTQDVPIEGLNTVGANVQVLHAATERRDGQLFTHGGRVMTLVATGTAMEDALTGAYASIGKEGVHFAGMQYRRDIGRS